MAKYSNRLVMLAAVAILAIGVALAWRPLASQMKSSLDRQEDIRRKREAFDTKAVTRDKAESQAERKWLATPASDCAAFGRGSGPQLCIEHLGPVTAPIGTPVPYRVRWRNLPAGAYIRVWSRNAAESGRWRYLGAQGAIAPQALGAEPQGDVRVAWDGRSIYCAPTDAPMMCDVGEVGRYVLRAAIMTGSDPFWPSFPPRDPVPVAYLARSETAAFELSGSPQPVSRPGSYFHHPEYSAIVEAIGEALPEGALGADRYIQEHLDRLEPWTLTGGDYCARLDLDQPLTGSVDVCFPRSRRDVNGIRLEPGDITASSNARVEDGLLRAEQAKAKAAAYAVGITGGRADFNTYPSEEEMVARLHPDPATYDGSYQGLRDSARDAGLTFVEINQPTASFQREAEGSWWLVELGLWIGTVDGPRIADWGRLALRVDHDGHVCRVDELQRPAGSLQQERLFSGCRPGSRRRI